MDYAELTLGKELITVEWALNKWSDSQIEEHKEYYKKAKKRKQELINGIDKLNERQKWINIDVYQDMLNSNPCFVKTDKGNIYLLDYYTSNSSICETQSVIEYFPINTPNF